MSRVSEEQIAEFRETFGLFDNRGDGKIHGYQIGDTLRALGLNPTEEEVNRFLPKDDPDKRIGFEEFLPMYQATNKARDKTTADDFVEGLKVFDKDGNGTISAAELRHLLTTLGEKLTEDQCEQLMQGMEDASGNVNYEDFVHMVMNE